MVNLDPRKMTWAALLGQWVEFARSSMALPDDVEGRAWKAAVPDLIGLQAVTMALGETDLLGPDERALGLDRARLLVERHEQNLHRLLSHQTHPMIDELIRDAHRAIARAQGL